MRTPQEWIDYLREPHGWIPLPPDDAHDLADILEATINANEEMCRMLAEMEEEKTVNQFGSNCVSIQNTGEINIDMR